MEMTIAQSVSLKWFKNRNLEKKKKNQQPPQVPETEATNVGTILGLFLTQLIYQSVHTVSSAHIYDTVF